MNGHTVARGTGEVSCGSKAALLRFGARCCREPGAMLCRACQHMPGGAPDLFPNYGPVILMFAAVTSSAHRAI
jgi:hypothetical protein